MDLIKYDDYDKISETVRRFCAEKLVALEHTLSTHISGDFEEVTPNMAAAYVSVIKELGRLYGAHKPPRDPEAMIPATKVHTLLQAAQQRQEQAVAAAIAETEARILEGLHHEEAKSIESAKAAVLEKLKRVDVGAAEHATQSLS